MDSIKIPNHISFEKRKAREFSEVSANMTICRQHGCCTTVCKQLGCSVRVFEAQTFHIRGPLTRSERSSLMTFVLCISSLGLEVDGDVFSLIANQAREEPDGVLTDMFKFGDFESKKCSLDQAILLFRDEKNKRYAPDLLADSIIYGNNAMVSLLLYMGVDLNAWYKKKIIGVHSSRSESFLYIACGYGNLFAVNELLKRKADVTKGSTDFYRFAEQPIHTAAREGRNDILKALIDNGAKVTARDWRGATAMGTCASGECLPSTIRLLLECNKNLLNGKHPDGRVVSSRFVPFEGNILAWAVAIAGISGDGVKALLDAGANPIERDSHGNTALHYAARVGTGNRIRELLKASPHALKNNNGMAPLDMFNEVLETAKEIQPWKAECGIDILEVFAEFGFVSEAIRLANINCDILVKGPVARNGLNEDRRATIGEAKVIIAKAEIKGLERLQMAFCKYLEDEKETNFLFWSIKNLRECGTISGLMKIAAEKRKWFATKFIMAATNGKS